MALLALVCWTLISSVVTQDVDDVLAIRKKLLAKEYAMMLGNDVELSDSELEANKIIMKLKHEVLDNGFKDPGLFNLSKHFFDYKEDVKATDLFKIIKEMPKGAVLHAHDTALLDANYILTITYLPDLFVCFQEKYPLFKFADKLPDTPCETQWQSMRDARFTSPNIVRFDKDLLKYFTLEIPNAKQVYTDIGVVWRKFQNYFTIIEPLVTYKPAWEQYFFDTLVTFSADKIMYIEIRSVLPKLYELNGTVYDTVETAKSYKKVLDRFKESHADFYGAKLIYAPHKFVDDEAMTDYIKTARKLKEELPDFFAGFDLVGQEDIARPLKTFLPQLVPVKDEFKFFFHAGETNWYGSVDENIADAIALDTKRIGHGYALIKHPVLLEEVIRKNIGIEVNVVSNHVLKLVDDVRNHPLASYLAMNAPVVLSSDDPGVWGADPMSHDFYVAFVGVASRNADLKLLKKLCLNSLLYSTVYDKDTLLFDFEVQWTKWIQKVVNGEYVKSSIPGFPENRHMHAPNSISLEAHLHW